MTLDELAAFHLVRMRRRILASFMASHRRVYQHSAAEENAYQDAIERWWKARQLAGLMTP